MISPQPTTVEGFSFHLTRQRLPGFAPEYRDANGEPILAGFKLRAPFNWILLRRDKSNQELGPAEALSSFQGYTRGVAGQHSPDGLTNFILSGLSAAAVNLTPYMPGCEDSQ